VTEAGDREARYAEINERARRAFREGAAEEWQRANGRPPTEDELRRILARYAGDPMRTRAGLSGEIPE
jgi:hypothetical protein